jgi:hypothetical protein
MLSLEAVKSAVASIDLEYEPENNARQLGELLKYKDSLLCYLNNALSASTHEATHLHPFAQRSHKLENRFDKLREIG